MLQILVFWWDLEPVLKGLVPEPVLKGLVPDLVLKGLVSDPVFNKFMFLIRIIKK